MKAFAIAAAIAALLIAGCGSNEPARLTTDKLSWTGITAGDYELGAPIVSDNVTVVPVMYKSPPVQQGNEISLAEAKKLGFVEIIEIPGAEEVNRLRVHNKSDRPLLLIGGELLLGGKQDRIVAHDVIIPPGATQDVDVDCVEHGRWQGVSQHFDYSAQVVPSSVRKAAAYEDQGKVWANVAGYNSTAGAMGTESGTIQAGLNSPEVEKRVRDGLPRLSKSLADDPRVVGLIYVLNGEIKSMDLFGNSRLFQSSKDSLLHGFLAEAAVVKSEARSVPSSGDFKKFVEASINGRRQQNGGQDVTLVSGDGVVGNEVRLKAKGSAAGGVFVHGSYSR